MRLSFIGSISVQKSTLIYVYVWIELCLWCFMSYSAIYHGKIFDHKYTKPEEFRSHIEGGENWYYQLMFGEIHLTNIDAQEQQRVQAKCDSVNTLLVFVFGSYFIFAILFLTGMSKTLGTKCLLCPYVSFDISVLVTVLAFVIYGAFEHVSMLNRNGSFFLLVKLYPSSTILRYYQSLSE